MFSINVSLFQDLTKAFLFGYVTDIPLNIWFVDRQQKIGTLIAKNILSLLHIFLYGLEAHIQMGQEKMKGGICIDRKCPYENPLTPTWQSLCVNTDNLMISQTSPIFPL